MLSFPLWVTLIPYAIFLIIFIAFAWVDIHHLVLFGSFDVAGFLATFLFLAVSAYLLFLTWQMLATVDWNATVTLFENLGNAGGFWNL